MTLLPEISLPILLLGVLAGVGFCVWRAVVARKQLIAWIRRGVLVLLLGAMLAHPGVPGGLVPTGSISAKVIMVIDTSQSMAAEDWGDGIRLDGVRQDVKDVAYAFAGADLSVITFNSKANLNVPMTSDGSAVIEMVRALRPEIADTSMGSSISAAKDLLTQEVDRLQASDPGDPIVVLYMGDGEQTSDAAVDSFGDIKGKVAGGFVLGYGTEAGGKMKRSTYTGLSDEYVQDPTTGQDAVSMVDQGNLKQIASETGLTYMLRDANTSLKPALQGLSSPGDAELNMNQMRESRLDLYWVFAFPIAILLAWEGLHIARQIRKTVPVRAPAAPTAAEPEKEQR